MVLLKFLFYFLYLIAAELPLFLILSIRNSANDVPINFVITMLCVSIIINVILFGIIALKVSRTKKPVAFTNIRFESENKIKQELSDYFAFFLLPFFTFNLMSTTEVSNVIYEMFILFFLLTIFILRTNNLSTNIFMFMLFNIYEISVPGKSMIVLTPHTKADIEASSAPSFVRLIGGHYIYFEASNVIFRKLLLIICCLVLLILFVFYNMGSFDNLIHSFFERLKNHTS